MNAGVPKIDMHDICAAAFQEVVQELIFTAVNDRWPPLDKLQPAVPKRIEMGRRDELDIIEWETLDVLDFLRHHKGADIAQSSYLPVDVKHLRFEECCAVTGDDQF